MNRRTFLTRSAGLAAMAFGSASLLRSQGSAPAAAPAAPPPPVPPPSGPPFTEFKPLRRNTGIFTGRGGTIGWLASDHALAVIDTQFLDTAAACLAGLLGPKGRTVDVVLNTHHHFDHTSGNPLFKPVSRMIVAQANVPKLQFAAAEKAGTVDKQVFADTTFPEVWRHECGDEVVTAQYFGPAHTNGDAVMMFEKANVVHMGDLVFNRIFPYIDRAAGASVRGWIQRLEDVHRDFPADAIYVFGHGNSPKFGVTGTRDDLLVMRDLLTGMIEHVQAAIAAGRPRDAFAGVQSLARFPDVPASERLPGLLGTIYDELTAKT